ncbi:MAG: hypothetical protein ACREN8_09890 [Candidatus Dormibacteraceae bacterium]
MSATELNQQAVTVVKRAMRAIGLEGNISAFTRALKAEAGDAPEATTVGRWIKGDQTVPAWALFAASQASGVTLTDLAVPEADLVSLHSEVEQLKQELQKQSERSPEATGDQDRLDELGSNSDRIEALERELEKQRMLLAKILQSLDRIGAWSDNAEKRPVLGPEQ